MKKLVLSLIAFALVLGVAVAEQPDEPRNKAALVIVGTVKKITAKNSKFGGDGVMTNYTADVVVDKVDSGKGAKAGDTIKVNWYNVTKTPSDPPDGAYGYNHKLKAKDRAKFWLMGRGKAWSIIYNKDGIEKLKRGK